tara:strand:- start:2434 stop:3318 length:885 start_codon:yes stop_codon:yes gene_type:complete
MKEVEDVGGMVKAIELGIPKMRIEESSAKRQARVDSKEETIVGVNKYQPNEQQDINILSIDNENARKEQVTKLNFLKKNRDLNKVKQCLVNLTSAAEENNSNLLELSIEAAINRCTIGEITEALEKVYNRHKPSSKTISGVYASSIKSDHMLSGVKKEIETFKNKFGRRPRILVVKMGQDGHDRGSKLIATAFADLGFDVDIGPLFQTPEEAAKQAVENDVHIIGVSTLAAGHKTLVPILMEKLKKLDAESIKVICGGVIPPNDYSFLKKIGVTKVFGPGTSIPDAALEIIKLL